MKSELTRLLRLPAVAAALVACSPSGSPDATGPAGDEAPGRAAAAEARPVEIEAPAGRYAVDRSHTTLAFSVPHLGLSNYVTRFTDYEIDLHLDPDDPPASSVDVTIDPASVETDFAADYTGTHPDSGFSSWNEDLAQSDKFFNAGEYPQIRFTSTDVESAGTGEMRITGDLTLLGQTHPVTLTAEVVGSAASHPAQPDGGGAIGFTATGTFKRSTFGMDYLLEPPLVGDTVTLRFEGEFVEVTDDQASPAG